MTRQKADEFAKTLEIILTRAAHTLGSALANYWPATGNNDCAEANVIVHVAAALAAAKFAIYSEVALEPRQRGAGDGAIGHLDLLAHREGRWVALEAKRLYSAEQAARIADDWKRLTTHQPTTAHENPPAAPLLRVVLATTWEREDRKTAGWWRSPTDRHAWADGPGWAALGACLKEAKCDGAKLQHAAGWGTQWLLWAFGEVPGAARNGMLRRAPA